jgi:DNA-binding transcriptional regulator of glucitol operon
MRNRWFTRRAITLHVAALVAIGVCLALGWWQLHRAMYDHNQLSWGYTIEWPLFAGYAAWMWWKLLHEEPGFRNNEPASSQRGEPAEGAASNRPPVEQERARGPEERELAAYNEYLADLDAGTRRTRE